jgi:hypothetical protein
MNAVTVLIALAASSAFAGDTTTSSPVSHIRLSTEFTPPKLQPFVYLAPNVLLLPRAEPAITPWRPTGLWHPTEPGDWSQPVAHVLTQAPGRLQAWTWCPNVRSVEPAVIERVDLGDEPLVVVVADGWVRWIRADCSTFSSAPTSPSQTRVARSGPDRPAEVSLLHPVRGEVRCSPERPVCDAPRPTVEVDDERSGASNPPASASWRGLAVNPVADTYVVDGFFPNSSVAQPGFIGEIRGIPLGGHDWEPATGALYEAGKVPTERGAPSGWWRATEHGGAWWLQAIDAWGATPIELPLATLNPPPGALWLPFELRPTDRVAWIGGPDSVIVVARAGLAFAWQTDLHTLDAAIGTSGWHVLPGPLDLAIRIDDGGSTLLVPPRHPGPALAEVMDLPGPEGTITWGRYLRPVGAMLVGWEPDANGAWRERLRRVITDPRPLASLAAAPRLPGIAEPHRPATLNGLRTSDPLAYATPPATPATPATPHHVVLTPGPPRAEERELGRTPPPPGPPRRVEARRWLPWSGGWIELDTRLGPGEVHVFQPDSAPSAPHLLPWRLELDATPITAELVAGPDTPWLVTIWRVPRTQPGAPDILVSTHALRPHRELVPLATWLSRCPKPNRSVPGADYSYLRVPFLRGFHAASVTRHDHDADGIDGLLVRLDSDDDTPLHLWLPDPSQPPILLPSEAAVLDVGGGWILRAAQYVGWEFTRLSDGARHRGGQGHVSHLLGELQAALSGPSGIWMLGDSPNAPGTLHIARWTGDGFTGATRVGVHDPQRATGAHAGMFWAWSPSAFTLFDPEHPEAPLLRTEAPVHLVPDGVLVVDSAGGVRWTASHRPNAETARPSPPAPAHPSAPPRRPRR